MRLALSSLTLLLLLAPGDARGQRGPWQPGEAEVRQPDELASPLPIPTVVSNDSMDALGEVARAAVFRVRTTTDLGEYFRPRFATGDGAASWVRLTADEPPVLITTYAHIAQATTIEVRVGGAWQPATMRYGTAMFDLAALQVPEPPDEHSALPLASNWSLGSAVYSPTVPADEGDDASAYENIGVVIGAMGDPPTDEAAYYARSMFSQHNGYPVLSIDARVLGLTSLIADDRHGGVLTVTFENIRAWHREWPQLDTTSPIGWEPRVRTTTVDVESGRDALNAPRTTTPASPEL